MFKTKISTLMIVFLLLFVIADFVGYSYLIKTIKNNQLKSEEILFYNLQRESNKLLTHVLHKYTVQKKILEEKHKEVYNYFSNHSYDISLKQIYKKINKEEKNNPYNIYITDENLKIVNTTFKPDLGFDLSFAKKGFDTHREQNLIGVSAPIFETYSTNFFSFSDTYLPHTNQLLQVSYRYPKTEEKLKRIQNIIEDNEMIVNSNAYIIFKDGYVGDFVFKSFKAYKMSLDEIKQRLKKGKELSHKIKDKNIAVENFRKNDTNYKVFYFSQDSIIFDDAKIIYSVILDQSKLEDEIRNINLIMFILSIIGVLAIIAIFKIRYKEVLLTQKDMFIKHSVHEIKTPLSIISLNNQLRDKMLGPDKYSVKINSAIKTLQNSYEDMSYLLTKDKLLYEKTKINLSSFLEKRVDYFQTIATAQARELKLVITNDSIIIISEVELTRLIDNNLSNAIKYSKVNSQINVILENGTLTFISTGNQIKNRENIFKKYERENFSVGGHGLGLSIVSDIALKHDIKIDVNSQKDQNTFTYTFNCHNIDT